MSATRDPPRIDDDARRDQPDVEVGEADDDEARPGPAVVATVQLVRPGPEAEAERRAVERVEVAADEVARRVAAERVAGEGDDVREHDRGPEADAEATVKSERPDGGPPQER